MTTKIPKYRPSLTPNQIEHILNLAKLETPISSDSISIIATLAPFKTKIDNSGLAPAYTLVPKKPKIEDNLGFQVPDINPLSASEAQDSITKEEYWEQCYNKWLVEPTSLSLKEIEASMEHRYLNDLMSLEEITAFEQSGT